MTSPILTNPARNNNLLFENFTMLVTAPEGIPKLRELILQLAVQGKLGTQDPGDEPAKYLLEEILKERDNFSKKKDAQTISPDEYPFAIPKQWVFTKVGEVAQIIRGVSYKKGDEIPLPKENYFPILRSNNITKEINFEKLVYISKDHIEDQKWIQSGDLIVAMSSGSANLVGKAAQIDTEFIGSIGAFCGIIRPTKLIEKKFLKYFFQCPYYRSTVSSFGQGIGINNLGTTNLQGISLPLPPFAEQHRIVKKVDRLMALCDELEAKQQQERAGCLRLGTASLAGLQNAESLEEFERLWVQVCEAFEKIFDCPENVAMLRQTILQLAVQGRLVRQEPGDEPAGKLVEWIRKEKERLVKEGKIKKEKPHEPVHTDEVPFILPNQWRWCRFGEVATIETNIVPPNDFQNLPHVAPDNIEKRTGRLLHYRTVAEDDVQSPNHHFYPNQIVYSKIRPNLSKLTIVDFEGLCSADMYPIYSHIFNKYLKTYMLSLPFYHQAVGDENRLAMPKINQIQLNLIYVAVPPLAEQHRIVEKVDALMALCDELEARLKERAGVQGRYANAVVKQVAG